MLSANQRLRTQLGGPPESSLGAGPLAVFAHIELQPDGKAPLALDGNLVLPGVAEVVPDSE